MAKEKVLGPDRVEIFRAARSMIDNHGARAAEVARRRAQNLDDSASEGRQTWERISAAIENMRAQPFHAAA